MQVRNPAKHPKAIAPALSKKPSEIGIVSDIVFYTQVNKKMDDDAYAHAVVADAAYKFYGKGEEEAQERLDTFLEGYTIDPDSSDDHAVTVLRPDGKAMIGYRGTDPTNIYDLAADALVASGYHRERNTIIPFTRFQRASDFYDAVSKKYEISSVTGHSLGGSLADFISRNKDVDAYTFNAGESPFELMRFGMQQPSRTKLYTTGVDPISLAGFLYKKQQKVTEVPVKVGGGYKYLDYHSLDNFLPSPRAEKGAEKVQKSQPIQKPAERVKKLCRIYPELCPKGD